MQQWSTQQATTDSLRCTTLFTNTFHSSDSCTLRIIPANTQSQDLRQNHRCRAVPPTNTACQTANKNGLFPKSVPNLNVISYSQTEHGRIFSSMSGPVYLVKTRRIRGRVRWCVGETKPLSKCHELNFHSLYDLNYWFSCIEPLINWSFISNDHFSTRITGHHLLCQTICAKLLLLLLIRNLCGRKLEWEGVGETTLGVVGNRISACRGFTRCKSYLWTWFYNYYVIWGFYSYAFQPVYLSDGLHENQGWISRVVTAN